MNPKFLPKEVQEIFAGGRVLHGPFAGLTYPEFRAAGSALYPKLLGSYESELHPWVREICDKAYSEIIDIGCGEGYYAVGLARAIPDAKVYAYDTALKARRLCTACAMANKVGQRVNVRGRFEATDLRDIRIRRRGLIICDCEGEELQIFTAEQARAFAQWDILIETHDFININISTTLRSLFCETHKLRALLSTDDIQKAKTYHFPEIVSLNLETRLSLLAECRPSIMEWLFFETPSRLLT